MLRPLTMALASILLVACATTTSSREAATASNVRAADFAFDAYPSTYRPIASPPVLIANATILTGDGGRVDRADVLLRDGVIAAIGSNLEAGADTIRVDGTGKWITPGLIDVHSHMGSSSQLRVRSLRDGNESTAPVTAQVWIEHSVWPHDPSFATALAGGVTAMQILPGSGNLIGGRSVTLKNIPATTVQDMKFPGAPHGLKVACGENPKGSYGHRGGPATRMGNMARYRTAFIEAQEYARKRGSDGSVKRDLKLDTLAGALAGDVLMHVHCYRSDEMAQMIDLSKEFGFQISAFHHGVEAYKIAGRLARENICGALWGDWWGFKLEAWDGIQENIALVDRVENGCAILHSDSAEGIQRLNQEAAKVIANARRVGMEIPPERAIRWLTQNAARSLGVLDVTGTLEVGKMADVVVWSGNPFSVYAQAEQVYIDGARLYDRNDPTRQPVSDFMLGGVR